MLNLFNTTKILSLLSFVIITSVSNAQKIPKEQFMNAYVVIADTSQNYVDLRDKMFKLNDQLKAEIETMDRGFDSEKNLICLPLNAYDEIYAGEYFPRRYPSESLSLEYYNYYVTNEKTMSQPTIALVTTITADRKFAKLKLAELKIYSKHAFMVKSKIYMGCIH